MIGVDLWTRMACPILRRRRDPCSANCSTGSPPRPVTGRDPGMDLQQVEAISGALMLMPLGLFPTGRL
jgi:hypothetical protein